MKHICLSLLLVAGAFSLAGCGAQQAFILPTGMRSSTQQVLVVGATEEAFKTLDLSDLAGRKVYLEVTALSNRQSARSPEESYITSYLQSELLKVGADVVNKDDAEVALIIDATAGADFYHRMILADMICCTNLTKGVVSYKAVLYSLPENKIISMKEGKAEEEYKETYVLGFIGPLH